jgi:hypothetical protein
MKIVRSKEGQRVYLNSHSSLRINLELKHTNSYLEKEREFYGL